MNGRIALVFALPLALGLSTALAQEGDDEEEVRYGLPEPAAQQARDASGVIDNDNAQRGLAIANEATMRIMDDAEAGRPDAVTANIPLPPRVQEDTEAVENARGDSETAEEGRATGLDNARENAAEQAQDALNAAQEAREQRGRGRGNRPEDRPDPRGPPRPPGPPGS